MDQNWFRWNRLNKIYKNGSEGSRSTLLLFARVWLWQKCLSFLKRSSKTSCFEDTLLIKWRYCIVILVYVWHMHCCDLQSNFLHKKSSLLWHSRVAFLLYRGYFQTVLILQQISLRELDSDYLFKKTILNRYLKYFFPCCLTNLQVFYCKLYFRRQKYVLF